MTLAEHHAAGRVLDFRDPRIVITRTSAFVEVSLRARSAGPQLIQRLRHVLLDLAEHEDKLALSLELSELVALDTELLDVLLDTAERLVSCHGSLTVRTAVGQWRRPYRRESGIS